MDELLLNTTKFRVERRTYDIPEKGQASRELVVHPGAVLILPVLNEDSVVMIRNYRFAVEQELLELPAGTLEPDESPESCAFRELEEETGYRADRMDPLVEFYTSPGFTTELMYTYVARNLTRSAQRLDETEQIRVEVMSWDAILEAVHGGQIRDGKTLTALLLFDAQRKRKS
jgi:ADP-ribose pyrophosphatase